MKSSLMKSVASGAKLAGAGGVIFAIGFVFVTQDPTSKKVGPTDAVADISEFETVPESESARFTEAMGAIGLRPRVYDYNGNLMFFAVGSSPKRPHEVAYEMQEIFVEYGVNEENRADMTPVGVHHKNIDWSQFHENPKALEDAVENPQFMELVENSDVFLSGDVVPTRRTDDYVEMIGFTKNREGKDVGELLAGDQSNRKVANLMGGYKWVDARWLGDETEVTAVWTHEGFDADRMDNKTQDQSPPDPVVPSCMGCERTYRVQSMDGVDSFSSNMFYTAQTVDQTYDFYLQRMEEQGWYIPATDRMLQHLSKFSPELAQINEQGRVLHLERGTGEAMVLSVMPMENGDTVVVTTREARGAELAHPEKGQQQ